MCSKRSTVPPPGQPHARLKKLGVRQTTQQFFAVLIALFARKVQSSLSLQVRQFGNLPSPSASSRTPLPSTHLSCGHHLHNCICLLTSSTNFQQNQIDSGGSFSWNEVGKDQRWSLTCHNITSNFFQSSFHLSHSLMHTFWRITKEFANQKELSLRNVSPVEMDEEVQLIRQSTANASQLKAKPCNSWKTWMGMKYTFKQNWSN